MFASIAAGRAKRAAKIPQPEILTSALARTFFAMQPQLLSRAVIPAEARTSHVALNSRVRNAQARIQSARTTCALPAGKSGSHAVEEQPALPRILSATLLRPPHLPASCVVERGSRAVLRSQALNALKDMRAEQEASASLRAR